MARKKTSKTIINIKLSAKDVKNIILVLNEFRLHKKVKKEENWALLERFRDTIGDKLKGYSLSWEEQAIKSPKPKKGPVIPTPKLKKEDIPTSKSYSKKQIDFVTSFISEGKYGKKIFDDRLQKFRKKYSEKQYNKITIREIRTALFWEYRHSCYYQRDMNQEFLNEMYSMLRRKIK
ncbi:hypothetical protein HOK51_01585 [Candidatus Woesearchaeota archaeon]|jgi:hypothetical protein|nr:hypothetical protein [Candidatus Woesearchaeota archaeon]MBT6518506.1 hypothetical protein [Candidatus Woesearchaeota archaeon]MBT7368659.1 hypothetical protein [Candidatus Woesearchaeota archaeon]